MQYDTIEELTLELALYPNKKLDILEDCARECEYGWFAVAKDGNCALFDSHGELDDISKITSISEGIIPKDIEKIIIPDSVTSIDINAFYNCANLTSVVIPNGVTNIAPFVFYCCKCLTSVRIPDSVTSIGKHAFSGCSGLTSVTIPNSVTSIGSSVFYHCTSLTNVTIPNSVMNIGESAFWGCSNLKELLFKGKTVEEVKSMENYPWGIRDESIVRCSV